MVKTGKPYAKILLFGILVLVVGVLAACNTNVAVTEKPNNDIALPVVGSEVKSETQAEPSTETTASPEPNPESQVLTNTETAQLDAYPAPTMEPPADEADNVKPKPTSRGADLSATDPSTVALASGKVQLVEFFAFW